MKQLLYARIWYRCGWAVGLAVGLFLLVDRPAWAQTERLPAYPANTAGNVLYHPYIPNDADGEQTVVEVLNLAATVVEFSASFYDATGAQVQTLDDELAPAQLLPIDVAALPNLPAGDHTLTISATGPIATLVRVATPVRAGSTVGGVGLYQGMAQGCGDAAFGPFYGDDPASQLALANPGSQVADVGLSFYYPSGSLAITTTVEITPQGMALIPLPAQLPDIFVGMVTLRSNWPVVGLLVQRRARDGIEFIPGQPAYTLAAQESGQPAIHYPVPRFLYYSDLGGGTRSTLLFIGASAPPTTTLAIDSFFASGALLDSMLPYQLTGKQSGFFLPPVWMGRLQSVLVRASQPLYVVEQTDYQGSSPYATAGYGQADPASCANWLRLPYVAAQERRYSIIYVQNVDTDVAPVAVTYRDRAGLTVAATTYEIEANGVHAFDLRTVVDLPAGFEGSAEIFTPTRLLCTQVDEYGVGQRVNGQGEPLQPSLFLPAIFTP